MEAMGEYAGLVEIALTFVAVVAFGIHQMRDLRRERERREKARRSRPD